MEAEDSDVEDISDNENGIADAGTSRAKEGGNRRRRANTVELGKQSKGRKSVGRVPKGQDWWSQIDSFFVEKTKMWGDEMDHPSWKASVEYSLLLKLLLTS